MPVPAAGPSPPARWGTADLPSPSGGALPVSRLCRSSWSGASTTWSTAWWRRAVSAASNSTRSSPSQPPKRPTRGRPEPGSGGPAAAVEAQGAAFAEEAQNLRGRHWAREEEPLVRIQSLGLEPAELLLGLHPLCDHAKPEVAAEGHQRVEEGAGVGGGGGLVFEEEAAVDLDRADRQVVQLADIGVARAEIV